MYFLNCVRVYEWIRVNRILLPDLCKVPMINLICIEEPWPVWGGDSCWPARVTQSPRQSWCSCAGCGPGGRRQLAQTPCHLQHRNHKLICRDRPAQRCVYIKELTKIPFKFFFCGIELSSEGNWGVFEDYSEVIKNKEYSKLVVYGDSLIESQKSIN